MSTRQVFGVVGAVIGAFYGNPQLGYVIGSMVGGAIDPEVIKGPSIGDIATQTSQEGVPRPIVFGLSPPIAGNIIVSGEVNIVRQREGGKGGPEVETEHAYRTYAIGICEGPISRVVRVWRNAQLVYDQLIFDPDFTTDPNLDDMRERMTGNNAAFIERARFYLGEYNMPASPELEAEFGIGTTPAHRGTAYLVMQNDDLTDFRGAIPQYMFQVEICRGQIIATEVY